MDQMENKYGKQLLWHSGMLFWVWNMVDLFTPIPDYTLSHSLGLFPDLLHKLLDVVLQEFDFLVLARVGFLQPYDTLHQHSLVHLRKAVRHHHGWTWLVLRRTIVRTTASSIKRAWDRERNREEEKKWLSPKTCWERMEPKSRWMHSSDSHTIRRITISLTQQMAITDTKNIRPGCFKR